jgi:putative PIN family toxin of toxin-antitoxin system
MRKIVLDTSVVVSGLRTRLGAGNAVLRLVAERRLVVLATPPLFLEYEDALKCPEHRLVHGLGIEAIDEFLAELAALIEPAEVHFQWRPQSKDPNDEMVLARSMAGRTRWSRTTEQTSPGRRSGLEFRCCVRPNS